MACASPRRSEIDAAIVSGNSLRSLEKRFGVSATALRRHKAAHLSPALVAVAQETGAKEGGREVRTLVDQLADLLAEARNVLQAAIAAKNPTQALAAIREVRATLELYGKATGQFKDSPTVSVNLQTSPEHIALRQRIVDSIPPELRPAVARRLAQLD